MPISVGCAHLGLARPRQSLLQHVDPPAPGAALGSPELFLSETTVKTHVAHAFDELGACNRVQAVVLAYEAGVVTPGGRTAVVERPPADPAT